MTVILLGDDGVVQSDKNICIDTTTDPEECLLRGLLVMGHGNCCQPARLDLRVNLVVPLLGVGVFLRGVRVTRIFTTLSLIFHRCSPRARLTLV